jgi:integrase
LIATLKTFAAGDDKARKVSARAIILTLLTGARPGEVLSATWDMFDLEAWTWTKPSSHVKQKRIHHLAALRCAARAGEISRTIYLEG